ncbi:phosphate acetyltransferase [Salinicoccus halodurans]|uniref:Phosphate acetyltransferase n=1 Tax=Salinicoccus halodurans TaxID=407035 RepID=A0A0F7HPF9_9STAP|nr:phosphate acetyltransferase [Salinicoccus halodurans]AKG75057.1 phosphotransacetylase [Salinicoccus halodurans]SFK65210.1 phosphotransacetylase [Salinicoccus halodurans]
MSNFLNNLKSNLEGKNVKIVFPEGTDPRILTAAVELATTTYVDPIVLGDKEEIQKLAGEENLDLSSLELIDPKVCEYKGELAESFVERRKGKVTHEQADDILNDVNYFGTMLVYTGRAAGLVSGAVHSTPDTVRPALQIIKTKPGVSRTSGVFFMLREDELYVMGDCAINPELNADELAEVAVETAKTAESFDMEPRVALLSFSTRGSAKTEETEKVKLATQYAKEKLPDTPIDGELQFDAAFVPGVAEKKAPGSELEGRANVFVFPSLEAGNIGYKIAQRLGGFEAYGPILQGLNQPVNDLSRGCSKDEVFNLALFTATQALTQNNG